MDDTFIRPYGYIIVGGQIEQAESFDAYLAWWRERRLTPASAEVPSPFHIGYARWPDGSSVSTIFYGVRPWFETQITFANGDVQEVRYGSLDAAEVAHQSFVRFMHEKYG